ncbi:MAG: toll/interleukin-1 receptor domain-containing protein [Desulfobacteraceae bacterium]|nr:toll/interleukin-1 receptor domain-containing protein [Desulfobacteraceae bacterium]
MKTKVFISWGGELSRKLAECLRDWLPNVLQNVQPYFTPKDIEKGSKWLPEITKELDGSDIGIVCLTKENHKRPWILFETGALAKKLEDSRVLTVLFDIEPTDIEEPLSMFQATKFKKEDFKKLVIAINNSAGDSSLEPETLNKVFNKWWSDLKKDIDNILSGQKDTTSEPKRSDRELIEEILERTRLIRTPLHEVRRTAQFQEDVENIVNTLIDIEYIFGDKLSNWLDNDNARLRRPLMRICRSIGRDDLFRKFSGNYQHIEAEPGSHLVKLAMKGLEHTIIDAKTPKK